MGPPEHKGVATQRAKALGTGNWGRGGGRPDICTFLHNLLLKSPGNWYLGFGNWNLEEEGNRNLWDSLIFEIELSATKTIFLHGYPWMHH